MEIWTLISWNELSLIFILLQTLGDIFQHSSLRKILKKVKVLPSGIPHIILFFKLLPAASYLEDANWKAVTANNAVGKLIISNFISRQHLWKTVKYLVPREELKFKLLVWILYCFLYWDYDDYTVDNSS